MCHTQLRWSWWGGEKCNSFTDQLLYYDRQPSSSGRILRKFAGWQLLVCFSSLNLVCKNIQISYSLLGLGWWRWGLRTEEERDGNFWTVFNVDRSFGKWFLFGPRKFHKLILESCERWNISIGRLAMRRLGMWRKQCCSITYEIVSEWQVLPVLWVAICVMKHE